MRKAMTLLTAGFLLLACKSPDATVAAAGQSPSAVTSATSGSPAPSAQVSATANSPAPIASAATVKPSPAVSAAEPGPPPVPVKTPGTVNDCMLKLAKETITRYDHDKNGTLSEAEYADGRNGDIRYIRAPTDAEVEAMRRSFVIEFQRLDTNKDGQMTAAELAPSYAMNCSDDLL
jgi:hypothetical protein